MFLAAFFFIKMTPNSNNYKPGDKNIWPEKQISAPPSCWRVFMRSGGRGVRVSVLTVMENRAVGNSGWTDKVTMVTVVLVRGLTLKTMEYFCFTKLRLQRSFVWKNPVMTEVSSFSLHTSKILPDGVSSNRFSKLNRLIFSLLHFRAAYRGVSDLPPKNKSAIM